MGRKANVTGEYYRIKCGQQIIKTYERYTNDMYFDAFAYVAENKLAAVVERVTKWCIEKLEDEFDMIQFSSTKTENGYEGESVTASFEIGIPHFTKSELSRYNPVNGWDHPKLIDLDDLNTW
ncbi:hypothetical protein M5X17_31135 [Paenibacillus alvei]|uniref:hypothetical protein n=1 Tax=Paenibacillus alvei TaxID=44250 RepID=UPI002281EDD1|nr:hypothetical protein [Paenibacillus alvei]MCY9738148.1 hypothetical protein [Paenibacillus alvei]